MDIADRVWKSITIGNKTVKKKEEIDKLFDNNDYMGQMDINNFYNYNYPGLGLQIPLSLNEGNFENICDCSSYISEVLYEYGYKEYAGLQRNTQNFYNYSTNDKYDVCSFDGNFNPSAYIQVGDIVVRRANGAGHINIAKSIIRKDGQTVIFAYDCGSYESIVYKYSNTGFPSYPNKNFLSSADGRPGKVIRIKEYNTAPLDKDENGRCVIKEVPASPSKPVEKPGSGTNTGNGNGNSGSNGGSSSSTVGGIVNQNADVTENSYVMPNSVRSNFTVLSKEIWNYMIKNNFQYRVPNGHPNKSKSSNDAEYVNWVLYEYGNNAFVPNSFNARSYFQNDFKKYGYAEKTFPDCANISNVVKPGDIVVIWNDGYAGLFIMNTTTKGFYAGMSNFINYPEGIDVSRYLRSNGSSTVMNKKIIRVNGTQIDNVGCILGSEHSGVSNRKDSMK